MRIVSSILIVFYAIILQSLLLALFPYPGPATMLTLPVTFLTSLILSLINFFIIKNIKVIWTRVIYFSFVFIGFTIFTVKLYPKEEPFEQIELAYELYKNSEKVRYNDLFRTNYHKGAIYVTAALVKFRDSIPDQAFRILYCCDPLKEYYIAKCGGKFVTNNKHLLIDKNNKKDTVVFKDTYKGKSVEYTAPPVFHKKKRWGHNINNEESEYTIHFEKCSLKPLDGFNEIYYGFLK